MRVITTANRDGFAQYGQRWIDSVGNWPSGTEFFWFTEGYTLPYTPREQQMIEQVGAGSRDGWIERREVNAIEDFAAWKLRHAGYVPPSWKFNVVGYSHKMFAFMEATKDYDGVAVWLDADCVTYREIPPGTIEATVKDAYIAHYGRTGRWTETGLFVVDCSHPAHADFWAFVREVYLNDHYRVMHHWTDCFVLDAAIKKFTGTGQIVANNLSGDKEKFGHPMAMTELGRYVDHCKGSERKEAGRSPENKFRKEYERPGRARDEKFSKAATA